MSSVENAETTTKSRGFLASAAVRAKLSWQTAGFLPGFRRAQLSPEHQKRFGPPWGVLIGGWAMAPRMPELKARAGCRLALPWRRKFSRIWASIRGWI